MRPQGRQACLEACRACQEAWRAVRRPAWRPGRTVVGPSGGPAGGFSGRLAARQDGCWAVRKPWEPARKLPGHLEAADRPPGGPRARNPRKLRCPRARSGRPVACQEGCRALWRPARRAARLPWRPAGRPARPPGSPPEAAGPTGGPRARIYRKLRCFRPLGGLSGGLQGPLEAVRRPTWNARRATFRPQKGALDSTVAEALQKVVRQVHPAGQKCDPLEPAEVSGPLATHPQIAGSTSPQVEKSPKQEGI